MQERRRFTRWQVNRLAKFRLEQAVEEAFCHVDDINYKGAQIILDAKLPEDTAFRLNLRLSEECSFEAEVWVAWHKVVDGINHYGIYFSKIRDADKDKIYKFINMHYPSDLKEKWWGVEQAVKPQEAVIVAKDYALGSGSIEDHRIFERFPVQCSARFLNLNNGKEGLAQTVDISAKGLGLSCDQELLLNTPLEIWLQMPGKGEPLYIRGEVAWTKTEGLAGYHFGVQLEKAALMGISHLLRSQF